MNRLRQRYYQQILPELKKSLKLSNDLSVPRLTKLVVNIGVTDEQHRDQAIANVSEQIAAITGQKPALRKAKKSIASFKLREGDSIGLTATLRGERMYAFLDKVISIVLPQVKDFQGLSLKSFDGQGNYNFGLYEQIIFPEINYDKIDQIRGLQLTLVTSTKSDSHALELLKALGVPFQKQE